MIVAIEGLIPVRRAVSSEKKFAPPLTGQIYEAALLRLCLAPETLKETHALPIPPEDQKRSNFIELYKNQVHTEPY